MYDWELTEYIKTRNGILSSKEYLHICDTCPQVDHIKYEPYENCYYIWTREGNNFKFQVYYAE